MTAKMYPKIKRKWCEALRSGKYKQATGMLATDDGGYCCLGVLAQVAIDNGIGNWDIFYKSSDYLPDEVAQWAGVEDCDPHIRDPRKTGIAGTLAELNDSGANFATIADVIEKQL